MGLGERINKIRKEKKISIDELCIRSGIPKGTLSKITAGITANPTLETVRAIANALGCTLDDLEDFPAKSKISPPEAGRDVHNNIILIAGRDGSQQERRLSDQQLAAIKAILDQMPDVPDDL